MLIVTLIILIILSTAVVALLGVIALTQQRRIATLRDLSTLKQNSADLHRLQLKEQLAANLKIVRGLDGISQDYQKFFLRYKALQKRIREHKIGLMQARHVNEDLTHEFSKSLQSHHKLEEELEELKERLSTMQFEKFEKSELRQEIIRLSLENRKLKDRNEDLEYALNLESVSWLESLQERELLYSAIDDVRRSLIRVLNPA